MLSICIPTYNYKLDHLIESLVLQGRKASVDFEILILEDGSDYEFYNYNAQLKTYPEVKHIVRKENCGRSITRNQLADTAQYEKILFIDCDSKIDSDNYIDNFIAKSDKDIVCGGTKYLESQKSEESTLRLKYGFSREMTLAKYRNINPNKSFTTNNFLISKEIFKTVRFREFLTKYGHEDSLFGYELKKENLIIYHIDNPVIHIGLETNKIFLNKTYLGIDNIILIKNNPEIDSQFISEIRIVKAYNKVKKTGFIWSFRVFFSIFSKNIEKHLLNSNNPKLFLFDILKLGYYSKTIYHEKRKKISN